MLPSLFSVAAPASFFQVWFVIYLYVLPLMLYTTWTTLSIMDLMESQTVGARWSTGVIVILLPWVGGAWYLVTRARALGRAARLATVVVGAVIWLVPLAVAIWLAGGPLGPKALT
jgi:hypothetical protein